MDADLASRLEQVLSDPAQMEQIGRMAKDLLGQTPGGGQDGAGDRPPEPPPPDAASLAAIARAFSGAGETSRSTALLLAMRPYMKPEKQAKLDRALQVARMAHIAGAVMRQYGDGHGL